MVNYMNAGGSAGSKHSTIANQFQTETQKYLAKQNEKAQAKNKSFWGELKQITGW
jgi:hypothetical protein